MRILVVEDDVNLCEALRDSLVAAGYAVDVSLDGEDALHLSTHEPYDAIALDIGLPKISGLDVLARAREAGVSTPVILLTARDAIDDRVRGLDAGADDYLPKPFATAELLARLRALFRRGPPGGRRSSPAATSSSIRRSASRRAARIASTSRRKRPRSSSTSSAMRGRPSRGPCSPSTSGMRPTSRSRT